MLRFNDLRSASWLTAIGAWLLCAFIAPVYFFWGGLVFGWLPFSAILNDAILKAFFVKDEKHSPAFCGYLEKMSMYIAMGGWLVLWPPVAFWIYGANEQPFITDSHFWTIVGAFGLVAFGWFFANLLWLRLHSSKGGVD